MATESTRPTTPDTIPADTLPTVAGTTWPPMSSNRAAGILWSERLFATARTASGDAARFAAGLDE